MAASGEQGQRSGLWHALQQLATGRGVYREDLLEALAGDLRELRDCWGVSLASGLAARQTIIANLNAHVESLSLPDVRGEYSYRELKQRFIHAVEVSFNTLADESHAALRNSDLTSRRRWMAHKAPAPLRVSQSTSQRYLTHALYQIEQQILASGYKPVDTDAAETELPGAGNEQLRLYVDREDLRGKFEAALRRLDGPAKVVAIVGLPGMGKTWLARAMATTMTASPPVAVRCLAGRPDSKDLQAALQLCGIDPKRAIDHEPITYLALLLSDARAPDILIIDNLESTSELRPLLPAQFRSTVIATCRRADDAPRGCAIVPVGQMTEAESRAMVLKRLPDCSTVDASTLASTLHHYPLVIDHACRLLSTQSLSVPEFCLGLKERLGEFSGLSKTEEDRQTLIVVLSSLEEALRAKNPQAARLLSFLAHGGLIATSLGHTLPQGLFFEALIWASGYIISPDEYFSAVATLNEFFYLEFGHSSKYDSFELDSIRLHPLVSQLLATNAYVVGHRVTAAACLVPASITYRKRPEVVAKYGEQQHEQDMRSIDSGLLALIRIIVVHPESREYFTHVLDDANRWAISVWFCSRSTRLPDNLRAGVLKHIDLRITSLSQEEIDSLYGEIVTRYADQRSRMGGAASIG